MPAKSKFSDQQIDPSEEYEENEAARVARRLQRAPNSLVSSWDRLRWMREELEDEPNPRARESLQVGIEREISKYDPRNMHYYWNEFTEDGGYRANWLTDSEANYYLRQAAQNPTSDEGKLGERIEISPLSAWQVHQQNHPPIDTTVRRRKPRLVRELPAPTRGKKRPVPAGWLDEEDEERPKPTGRGVRLPKGSQAAKEHMAKLRAMRRC